MRITRADKAGVDMLVEMAKDKKPVKPCGFGELEIENIAEAKRIRDSRRALFEELKSINRLEELVLLRHRKKPGFPPLCEK